MRSKYSQHNFFNVYSLLLTEPYNKLSMIIQNVRYKHRTLLREKKDSVSQGRNSKRDANKYRNLRGRELIYLPKSIVELF